MKQKEQSLGFMILDERFDPGYLPSNLATARKLANCLALAHIGLLVHILYCILQYIYEHLSSIPNILYIPVFGIKCYCEGFKMASVS